MQKKKILIACPISNRAWILPYYLRNLYNLDYDKKSIDILWIVNQCKDDSANILQKFKKEHDSEYRSINIQYKNPKEPFVDIREPLIRNKKTYAWLAELRTLISMCAINTDCDYLFSCDSDILLPKDALSNLVSCQKDYVAGLLYNGYIINPDNPWKTPNILREVNAAGQYEHIINHRVKNPYANPKDYCFKVDFTGAVFLASKRACKYLIFTEHPQGEDEPACLSLRQHGFELWCNPYTYCQHVMSKELLENFKDFGI